MAKKSKKNLQKLLTKKQHIQQLTSRQVTSILPVSEDAPEVSAAEPVKQLPPLSHAPELRRTVISLIVIAAVLTAFVIYDRQSSQLSQLGELLYSTLKLGK
jgi:hypothetical protein